MLLCTLALASNASGRSPPSCTEGKLQPAKRASPRPTLVEVELADGRLSGPAVQSSPSRPSVQKRV